MSQQKVTHFCESCQEQHTLIENVWSYWRTKIQDGKQIYWCARGIDCAGCHRVHEKIGVTKGVPHPETGKTIWFCQKWFKSHGNGQIDWSIWSPQEVVSAVHLGEEREKIYGPDTEDHSVVHTAQKQQMIEALTELEEQEELEGRWR